MDSFSGKRISPCGARKKSTNLAVDVAVLKKEKKRIRRNRLSGFPRYVLGRGVQWPAEEKRKEIRTWRLTLRGVDFYVKIPGDPQKGPGKKRGSEGRAHGAPQREPRQWLGGGEKRADKRRGGDLPCCSSRVAQRSTDWEGNHLGFSCAPKKKKKFKRGKGKKGDAGGLGNCPKISRKRERDF